MKQISLLIIFSLSFLTSHGQACGKYRIKYLGTIQSGVLVKTIELPTTFFLHGGGTDNVEVLPEGQVFDAGLWSHLTSHLFSEPDQLLEYYKQQRDYLPITLTILEAGEERIIRIKLLWNDIAITMKEDEGFGNLFEINLGELSESN